MSDDAIRRALARLARSSGSAPGVDDLTSTGERRTFRETIDRATTATGDLDAAAAFVDEVGVEELERAVERADQSVSGYASDGREALRAFREFRDVAAGNHFHPGRGTSLGGDDITQSK